MSLQNPNTIRGIYKLKKKGINNIDIIRYQMLRQEFASVQKLVKTRTKNGKNKDINAELNDEDKLIIERYTRYLCNNMPEKGYRELCKRLNVNPNPTFSELDAIHEFKFMLSENNLEFKQGSESKKQNKTRPTKEDTAKRISLAKTAYSMFDDVAIAREEDYNARLEEELDSIKCTEFVDFCKPLSLDLIKLFVLGTFIYAGESFDFDFICDYSKTNGEGRKLLHKSFLTYLEASEKQYNDDWIQYCADFIKNFDVYEVKDIISLSTEIWDSWAYRFYDLFNEIKELSEDILRFSTKDWECIIMHHQLCCKNRDALEKITFAIEWLINLFPNEDSMEYSK